MFDTFKQVIQNLEPDFHFHFPSWFKCLSQGASALYFAACKWGEQLPTLDSHFPDHKKVRVLLSTAPGTEETYVEQGGDKDRKILSQGSWWRKNGKEERAWSLGQGGGMFSVNLHLVCYRWYRPPRTIICLGFPKQRWMDTPAYTGLFCLQLLESLLLVYYHRLPWVWWSQSRNTCPEFYSHIHWTPA